MHALVPGGGPSLDGQRDGQRWITTRHPTHGRRKKPYLVDNQELSRRFRRAFIAGMKRMYRQGRVRYVPPSLPGEEHDDFETWAQRQAEQDWNVYIEGPPSQKSDPEHVLKYLACCYLTGGPISDRRLISHRDGQVTFWARGRNKRQANRSRPFTLSGREFVRRWSLHILPHGFTRVRGYGGFSGRLRSDYLQTCRRLLNVPDEEELDEPPPPDDEDVTAEAEPCCPRCDTRMISIGAGERPAWRDIFADHALCPLWYQPWLRRNYRHPIRGPTR